MGGVSILLSFLIAILLTGQMTGFNAAVFMFVALFGFVGALDDWITIRRRGKGTKARYNLFFQSALAFLLLLYFNRQISGFSFIELPVLNSKVDLGYFYFPFGVLLVVGTVNAVNLTDGLDGLACGSVLIALFFFAALALFAGHFPVALFAATLCGVCLGFLWFNTQPARLFLGNTGAMVLGAALSAVAIAVKKEIWLLLIGGVFVIEVVSVILQVTSFKLSGQRIFKMAPLHHHFELCNWPESRIIMVFWLTGLVLGIAGVGII